MDVGAQSRSRERVVLASGDAAAGGKRGFGSRLVPQQGLKGAAFYWWRRELARREAEPRSTSLVPLHVTGDGPREGDPRIEIVLADGRRVPVTGSVDRQALSDVLEVLERRAC